MAQGDPASRRDELSGRVDLAARPPAPLYPKGRVRKKRERARREEERREETREGGRTLLGQKTIPQPPAPFGPGPGWRTLLTQGVKSARSSKSRLDPLSHPSLSANLTTTKGLGVWPNNTRVYKENFCISHAVMGLASWQRLLSPTILKHPSSNSGHHGHRMAPTPKYREHTLKITLTLQFPHP